MPHFSPSPAAVAAWGALLLSTGAAAQVTPLPGGAFAVRTSGTGQVLATFATPSLGGQSAQATVQALQGGWSRVSFTWTLAAPVQQDDLAVEFSFGQPTTDRWMPHLTPIQGVIAAERIFRSPAIIAAFGEKVFTAIPDLDLVGSEPDQPWYLDYDESLQRCWIGMSLYDTPAHVLFTKAPGMQFEPGPVELAFFVHAGTTPSVADDRNPPNIWREATRFLWDRYASPAMSVGRPHTNAMADYVNTSYEFTFGRWDRQLWLEGGDIGGVRLVSDYSESPMSGLPPLEDRRDSVWNQAWYCSLRSASGVYRWAERTGDDALRNRALKSKRLALAAPNENGIFPSVLFVGGVPEIDNAFTLAESRWSNSDRSPIELGITPDFYHVVDASNTALWMLRWYRELEKDPELLDYVRSYVKWLVTRQDPEGFFPAWLHPVTLTAHPVLGDSPETARSAQLLLEYADATGIDSIRAAGLRALDAVLAGPASENRWEDFETYWSDNFFGRATNIGIPFARNALYKQNTLSIFWTCEACLAAHRATGVERYLERGVSLLDQLSLWQQVWRPPYIAVPTLGGFGVMNADAEWNDSRQSLFAELYLDYYAATGEPTYFERGVAALKASFLMMYTPLNPETKVQWELKRPSLTSFDHGFQMENYAHDEPSSPLGGGIGFFNIFDWGSGSAAEAFARISDRWGHVYIDDVRGNGFGIDSVDVQPLGGGGWQLTDLTPPVAGGRAITVRYASGKTIPVQLVGTAQVP